MSVFDDIERDFPGGAPYLMARFDYLNRSSGPAAECVRNIVDDMFDRYPANAQEQLRHRLRLVDDVGHLSAFFELAVHELLIRSGHRVVQVEPPIPGTDRSPDFLVESDAGARFYLEATIATGRSRLDEAAQRRLDEAYRAIEAVDSPDFMFSVKAEGAPIAPVSGRRLRSQIGQWLRGLSYDAIAEGGRLGRALPTVQYEEHGVAFIISPVPRRLTRGERRGRNIAAFTLPPLRDQPQAAIAAAVAGKAGRYGALDLPYVIAVNAMAEFAEADSATDALFGTQCEEFIETADGFDHRPTRGDDGVLFSQGRAVNTRVSAVLSTERLSPWDLGERRARVIPNPWAARPLPNAHFGLDHFVQRDGDLYPRLGSSIRELFGLPAGWPEHV